MADMVNHPPHYHSAYRHAKCGETIECIDVTRHLGFALGNAVKYIWRAGRKGDELEDLRKAQWYLNDRITQLEDAAERAALMKPTTDGGMAVEIAVLKPGDCPDGGTCHHGCAEQNNWPCFRVLCCGPLSGVFPDDTWPKDIAQAHHDREAKRLLPGGGHGV